MNENRGEDGIPHRVPVIVVDMSTALYAFQALSAALYARRDEPLGRYIDVSLMQAATALQSIRLMASHLDGGTIRASGVFQTADGWMTIATVTDRDWRLLCEAMQAFGIGRETGWEDFDGDIAAQPRVAGAIDFTHPARAERRENFVRAQAGAGRKRHWAGL